MGRTAGTDPGYADPTMEIGLYSFAETPLDPATGSQRGAGRRLRHIVEEIELADRVGLDVYGLGEHHRPDYASSAPAVVLAAAAARTEKIRLTSAVSVLSSDDPVRVFQDFATLDLISRGRAEIMVGRGSFTESFPLFGQDLADYDDRPVYPRPEQDPLPVWVAVGGTPPSVVRAASLGLPMALAIIGGRPERFRSVAELYREVLRRHGRDPAEYPISINSHGFIAESRKRAAEIAFEPFAATMNRIGRERGWPPTTRAHFEAEAELEGALFLGDPDDIVEKILYQHELFDHRRFLIQPTVGPIAHEDVLAAIELLGTEVAPRVRRKLGAG